MKVLSTNHWEVDPFAARLFTGIKKSKRFTLIFLIIAALHTIPFLYLKITYPRDRVAPKPSPQIILWTPETTPSSVQAQMKFIQMFQDPSLLMLPQPYEIHNGIEKVLSRLPKLELSPSQLIAINPLLPEMNPEVETLSERANAAIHPRLQDFIVPTPIRPRTKNYETKVLFAASIQNRVIMPYPSLPTASAEILNQTMPTQIRIAVDDQGTIRHALIVMGSGSDVLDKRALDLIRRFKFSKLPETPNQQLTWGEVKFFWAFDSSQQAIGLPADS